MTLRTSPDTATGPRPPRPESTARELGFGAHRTSVLLLVVTNLPVAVGA